MRSCKKTPKNRVWEFIADIESSNTIVIVYLKTLQLARVFDLTANQNIDSIGVAYTENTFSWNRLTSFWSILTRIFHHKISRESKLYALKFFLVLCYKQKLVAKNCYFSVRSNMKRYKLSGKKKKIREQIVYVWP